MASCKFRLIVVIDPMLKACSVRAAVKSAKAAFEETYLHGCICKIVECMADSVLCREEAGPVSSEWTAKVGSFTGWNNVRDFYKATPLPLEYRINLQSFKLLGPLFSETPFRSSASVMDQYS